MMFTATTATNKVIALRKRIRLLAGGTSASKTISILLYLIAKAQADKRPTLTSVVSESLPHLKRGAIRDFINILQAHGYYNDDRWNRSDFTYTFETGSKIEFFSADVPSKVRGPRRDRLFVNEVNNVDKESWEQLLLRTREFAFGDWNPVTDFYMYEDYGLTDENVVSSTDPDVDFIILTYQDNESLEQAIVNEIEKRKHNKQWFKVYGQGKRGEVEGKIYKNWRIIDDIPHEARLERRGLDFGYSNDPTALVDVYYHNGGYIIDEQLYRKGMSNKDIADFINNLERPQTIVVADSAEPKSIDELKLYGVPVQPANKGQGSVTQGIQYVQDQQVSITKRSTFTIKEYRNYLWQTDKEGKIINKPEGGLDHALDAFRYALEAGKPVAVENAAYYPQDMLRRQQMNAAG
jgi:phage terminase large subunit